MILRVGSSGDNVLDLQNKLKNLGYTIDADSVYGSQTESVVRQFQEDYGLDIDGVAGDQTFGKLNSLASNTGTQDTGTQAEQKAPAVEPVSVQPYQKSDEVKNAYALIEQHKQNKPGQFSWGNQSALDKAYEDWKNRESFSYDPSSDPLYQLYKDQYAALGKIAMEDTMGQAAALTGGYGNSWAQTVGQQTYNNYMQQVNSMLPEFYGMAKQNYDEEGQKLLNELSILEGQRQTAYGEHRDLVGDWQNELNYLVGTASNLEDREYQQYRDTVADDRYLAEMDHERQQESFERLTGLISVGYTPSDADLLAAGMTRAQADALAASFTSSTGGGTGGNGGDSSSGNDNDDTKPLSTSEYKTWREMFADAEGNESALDGLRKQLAGMGYSSEADALYEEFVGEKVAKKFDGVSTFKASMPTRREFSTIAMRAMWQKSCKSGLITAHQAGTP